MNHGRGILLAEIVNPCWTEAFKADIYSQYNNIIPMKSLIPPSEKSGLHAMDIFVIELVKSNLNEGRTIEEVKNLLYDRINASAILSKSDKDARKRQIKATLDKLAEADQSAWGISKKLEEVLNLEVTSTSEEASNTTSNLNSL